MDGESEDARLAGRFLMAICQVLGIWQNEMRIPLPGRLLLVERDGHRWQLDERGYPVASEELMERIRSLAEREEAVRRARLDVPVDLPPEIS